MISSLGATTVIFSKDRPLQLEAALRSIQESCGDIARGALHVLYKVSTPAFAAGYRIVATEHPGVAFHLESDFKTDLIRLVETSSHVMFVVDDTLFVRPCQVLSATQVLDADAGCLGFSFRLGRNTNYCYSLDKPQPVPDFAELGSGLLTFDWTTAESDFGYPLELSSSLYRTSDVLPLLRRLQYRNPNTLESVLAQVAGTFRGSHPRIACCAQSVAFSIPANLVQTAWQNRAAGDPTLSPHAHSDAFARGERLDVDRYQGFVSNGCHQEVPFHLTKRQDVPTVSVVIPCYGQGRYLSEAVTSVVNQSYSDWDLVIVDDGSTDDTAAVAADLISRYSDRRLRLIRQPNAGLAAARNTGVRNSKGRYVLPLDADDAIAPTMLQQTVEFLERDSSLAVAYTDLQQFGEGARVVTTGEFDPDRIPEANRLSYCSLYRREVWEAVGGYNSNMALGYEDWDFWVGALERGYRFGRVPGALLLYRVRSGSMFSNAVAHDTDLRRQMRLNHPSTYRYSKRFGRWLRVVRDRLLSPVRTRLGAKPRVT